MKNWSLFALIVILCLLSFVGGRQSKRVSVPETSIDTLIVRDTIRIEKPLTKFVKPNVVYNAKKTHWGYIAHLTSPPVGRLP